ncbi:LPXTG cell wall anchor domain-containing protein, partial [Listeria monocytogenes]|nr:LPXTG cell wall anchor domain-containing protein [Listeria monocytogenes]
NNDTTPEVAGESQTGKDNTITSPEVTEPEVTEPEVTEPEVTEPEVTKPEVTEPVKKTPETKDKKQAAKPRAVETIQDIFPDGGLADAVRAALNKNNVTDVVTQAELDSTQILVAESMGVRSLEGIDRLSDLNELYFNNNNVSDLSPLRGMKNLWYVLFNNNNISDLSPLAGKKVALLEVNNNNISDITPLASMEVLDFFADNNEISDITPLANKSFRKLKLSDNKISDVSSLSNTTTTDSLEVLNQKISLPTVNWANPLSIINNIKGVNGNIVAPSLTSGQSYSGGKVIWNNLSNSDQIITYNWGTSNFSGEVTIAVQQISKKLVFDNDGQKKQQTVLVNDVVKEPTEPTKQGYTFTGWYDARSGGTKWDFVTDKMPASDLTLYARYEKNPDKSVPVVTPPKSNTPTPRTPVITNSNSQETTIVNEGSTWNGGLPKTGDVLSVGLPILGAGLLVLVGIWTLKKRKKSKM